MFKNCYCKSFFWWKFGNTHRYQKKSRLLLLFICACCLRLVFQGLFVADTNSTNHANKADSVLNLSVYCLNIMSMAVHLSFMFTNHVNKIIFQHPSNSFSVLHQESHTVYQDHWDWGWMFAKLLTNFLSWYSYFSFWSISTTFSLAPFK